MRFTWSEVNKIEYLAEKMGQSKRKKLFFLLANKIGIGELERNIGLVLEDPKIRNPVKYLIKLCQVKNNN